MDNKIITFSFCESFIDNLTKYIDTNFLNSGQDLSRLAIVFGGKRPALFLKRELAKKIKKSFYPPKFFTIDEFIKDTARKNDSFSETQDLDSCYLIYKLAQQRTPQILKGRETFAQFLPWTREILKFIAHLDLECVDSKSLQSIEANAQIGYAVPDDINRLLERIVTIREAYHEVLLREQQYSRGLQYSRAAEGIADAKFDEFDQILFCNFFYFHRSEEMIAKNLYERGKATLIFQGDQRKWPVLDRIAKNFSCRLLEGEQPETPVFDLKLYSGFDAHSQIGIVREILGKIKNLDDTVIVLPDPDQIIPLLSEMTAITEDFNISMGYPLRRSSLYTLCEFIFHAQLSRKEHRYYAKDYLKVLRHPFIKKARTRKKAGSLRS